MSCYSNNHKEKIEEKKMHTHMQNLKYIRKLEIMQYSPENLVTSLGYCDLKFVAEMIKIQL